MPAPMIMAGIMAGVGATTGAIAGGIGAGVANDRRNARIRRERNRLDVIIKQMNEEYKKGDIRLEEALGRLDTYIKNSSQQIKDGYQAGLKNSLDAIDGYYQDTINKIKENRDFIKASGNRQEQKEAERLDKEIESFEKGLRDTNEQSRTMLSQRRLTGASAVAALGKNYNQFLTFSQAAQEASGKIRADLKFNMDQAILKANNELKSAGLAFSGQESQLRSQMAMSESKDLQRLNEYGYRAEEGHRQAHEQRQDEISSQIIQAEAGKAGIGEEKPLQFSEVMMGVLGGMSGSGAADLFSQAMTMDQPSGTAGGTDQMSTTKKRPKLPGQQLPAANYDQYGGYA